MVRSLDHCAAEEITVSGVLSALADPTRLQIARVLYDGREHLQADFPADVTQSTLSHHMKRLRQAGIAWSRPDGTRCYVSLRPELEQRLPGLLTAILTAACGLATSRPISAITWLDEICSRSLARMITRGLRSPATP